MKKKIFIGFGIIFILLLFLISGNYNTRPTLNVTEKKFNFSVEKETEIHYRFYGIYHEITEKEGLDPLPKVGEKNASSPKRNKAEQIAANEFNISVKALRNILEKVEKTRPSEEELRIFQIYDDRLNETIDIEASGGELINEDKIRQEVANSLNISQEKLNNIWVRVFVWKQNE